MRVAFVENQLFEYRLPFLQALQERLDRLRVFVTGPGFDLPDSQLAASGLDVSRLRSVSFDRTLRYPLGFTEKARLDLPWTVLRDLARFQPDVLLSSEMGFRTLQAAAFRIVHPQCRLVLWARLSQYTEAGRGNVRKLLRKAVVSRADAIITNGSSGRRYLAGLGASAARVHVVHQASATGIQPSSPFSPQGPLRLLAVGRLVTSKGMHLLLPALQGYPPGSWVLTVAGDGPEGERLRAFASRHRLPVEFAGFVPRTGLPQLFAHHDVLAFPTLKDEWGLVVGEALRAGLPVLGSIYSEAVCELVTDGKTGWIMKPDSRQSMMAALDRAFTATAADFRVASELARESVQQLTPETMADQFLDVLRTARTAGAMDRLEVH
jgi:glycosyltransferase involved in cell wall biosynthesis